MRCEQARDLVPLYAVDLLDLQEAESLRAHLESGCPRCAAELASVRAALDSLPFAEPPEEPSPMAKARLLAAVRRERSGAALPGSGWRRALAVATAAAAVAATLTGVGVNRRYQAVTADLRKRIDTQREELASLRQQVRRTRETIQLVSSPGVKVIDLAGQGDRSAAAARVFWDRRRDSWQLYADGLPPARTGKTYQLWMVTSSAKISAGTFDPAAGAESAGRVIVPADAGPVVAMAVTEEPAGGSPQPTGAILMLGKS